MQQQYSPFWPILTLVIFLGLWLGTLFLNTAQDELAAHQQLLELVPKVQNLVLQEKKLLTFERELNVAAASDPLAAQLVREFKIPPPASQH